MAPKWKKEIRTDHKFDYVELSDFRKNSLFAYAGYAWVHIQILKSCAIYCSELWTAISLLAFNKWNSSVQPKIPFAISKWIFSGCIIFSYLLLIRDLWICRKILKSRDIATAYFNINVQRTYCVRDYNYYCLFEKLTESKKKKDDFAFFVLFTFKGWKRLILAEGPRQLINGFTIYSILKVKNFSYDIQDYAGGTLQNMILLSIVFSATMWFFSAIQLVLAAFLYVPLITFIRGNLKEYCCVKVDKRLSKLMAHYRQKRLIKDAKKKGSKAPKPTLPNIRDIELDSTSIFHYGISDTASISSRQGLVPEQDNFSQSNVSINRIRGPSHPHVQRSMTNTSSSSSVFQVSPLLPGSPPRAYTVQEQYRPSPAPQRHFSENRNPSATQQSYPVAGYRPGPPSRAQTFNQSSQLPMLAPRQMGPQNGYFYQPQHSTYNKPPPVPMTIPVRMQPPYRSRTAPPHLDCVTRPQPRRNIHEPIRPYGYNQSQYR
ncbi:putative vacuolar membrane protein [Neolecta irregularis DAH-3]|uniref:Putative vacuolar membrane protein n=1 Tax=Neolecta irregularis (strain DAH-3) TaxID=1198029 RepID=A0A1U7LP47_NEOID|nr:putative vacuolar membrane protein [Neolecta irregularis DAH-3]|eukprot:OLL24363.1 putative vacuolar membrane protein [Neolecta irregularis DAH-3]